MFFSAKPSLQRGLARQAMSEGFTLIELLILVAFVGIFSTILIIDLRGSSTSASVLERAALAVIADIRKSQSQALAGLTFQGSAVCGYGVHYVDQTSYLLYAGGGAICGSTNRNYQSGQDLVVQTVKLIESNVELKASFADIFFEPPDPKTFLNNSSSPTNPPITISIGFKNMACPTYCKTISVFPSGKIDLN